MAKPRSQVKNIFLIFVFAALVSLSFGQKYALMAGIGILLCDLIFVRRNQYTALWDSWIQRWAKLHKQEKIITLIFMPVFLGIVFFQMLPTLERNYLLQKGISTAGRVEDKLYSSGTGRRGSHYILILGYPKEDGTPVQFRYGVLSGDYGRVKRGDSLPIHYEPFWGRATVDSMEPSSTGSYGFNISFAFLGLGLWILFRHFLPFEKERSLES